MKRYPLYKDSKVKWIGNVPEHWKVLRLWGIADSFFKGNGITREDVFEDGDSPCLRYGDIYTKYNIAFSECKTRTNKARLATCVYLKNGDIAFTLTGELIEEIGKSIVYLGSEKCLVGGDIAVLRHSQNPGFLGYYLASSVSQQQKSFGKTKLKVVHTKIDNLKNVVVSLPPEPEQRAIVAFLDRAVEKIDGYIAAKEAEIEKLGTLKQSVIAKAVTQGLNPDVPMKDSGIPWLGNVPEHWDKLRSKNIFKRMNRPVEPDDEVITCFRDGEVTLRKNRRTEGFTESLKEIGYQGIRPGDLVVHQMDAFAGSIGVSDSKGKGTPVYICLQQKNDGNNWYYAYLLREMARTGYIKSLYRGIRERSSDFRFETLARLFLPVPPADEQQTIVDYISRKTQEIDGFITGIRAQIEKLKVYKQRLISDVVTGKICVCDPVEQAN